MNERKITAAILTASEKIAAVLEGLGPEMQGAILAELFSRWLAGHMVPDKPGSFEVEKMRQEVVENWLTLVYKMTPANEAMIREQNGLPPLPLPPKEGMN